MCFSQSHPVIDGLEIIWLRCLALNDVWNNYKTLEKIWNYTSPHLTHCFLSKHKCVNLWVLGVQHHKPPLIKAWIDSKQIHIHIDYQNALLYLLKFAREVEYINLLWVVVCNLKPKPIPVFKICSVTKSLIFTLQDKKQTNLW